MDATDSSIKVKVSPTQSAYFAGETFTVEITFTNTRTPSPNNTPLVPASAPVQKSHRRNAHSISSAPLARPPTSPGLSPRPPDFIKALGSGIGEEGRKGLIGNGSVDVKGKGKEVLEARRSALEKAKRSASEEYVQAYEVDQVIPRTTFTIPQNHPHARKQSVLDGHLQSNEVIQPQTSTLDTIAEGPTHSYPPRRPSLQALGHGHPHSYTKPIPKDTALLLYSYAQLSGTAHILPQSTPAALSNLRAHLLKKPVLGGGSMDIASTRRSHSRSTSLTGSLLSLLSPSSYTPTLGRSRAPSLSSQSDTSPTNVGLGLSVGAANPVEEGEEEMPLPVFEVQPAMLAVDLALSPGESRTYTYTLPLPSSLPPTFKGRMIRFSYELIVGTCRRGDSGEAPSTGVTVSRVMKVPIRVYNWVSVSRPQSPYDLLLPVRKHDGGKVIELGSACGDTKKDSSSSSSKHSLTTSPCGSLDDLRAYGERLLETFPAEGSTGVRIKEPAESVPESVPSSSSGLASGSGSQATSDPLRAFARGRETEMEGGEGELTGCREAVEILTRNPKKVSYDVTKDGVKVAILTFTKSAYRLGETVLGIVEINEREGRGKVISLSATLETNESLPASLGTNTSTSTTRRVHAEHHASFTGSTLRTTFALDIPSDASPTFGIVLSSPPLLGNGHINGSLSGNGTVAGAGPGKIGGLTWKVHLTLLVGVTAPNARVRGLTRDGAPTSWGSAWRAPVGIAPEQQEVPGSGAKEVGKQAQQQSWTSYLMSSFLGTGEKEYHDGDDINDDDEEVPAQKEEGEQEEGDWRDVQVEIVECEVPVVVWPGNTAFSAVDVVFEV